MNRIYQGRVIKVEIPDKTKSTKKEITWKTIEKWEDALWHHHQLFQDAVNYYTLTLAAMAADVCGNSPEEKALKEWVQRVRETWSRASRRAESFAGPQQRIAQLLKLTSDKSDFDSAARAILQSSRANPAQRAAAVLHLLAQKGDLNTICVDRLPWLASAAGKTQRHQQGRRFLSRSQAPASRPAVPQLAGAGSVETRAITRSGLVHDSTTDRTHEWDGCCQDAHKLSHQSLTEVSRT